MSQHGCPERLSNRSKGFQEDGAGQQTMEVLVETLTGTAFEMTVSPSDTVFAIKSKIFRVEGIPVSQQHLVYNLQELDDASSLGERGIRDGARLRLVLAMRGGPVATRRLAPPPQGDIDALLDSNREEGEWGDWGGAAWKVTVLVFRDGERVNMVRVRENHDGTYSPLDHNKYGASLPHLVEAEAEGGAGSLQDNAVTLGKMLDLRRRMESLSVQRRRHDDGDKSEMQKTRSEETLPVGRLLDETYYECSRCEWLAERCVLPPIARDHRPDTDRCKSRWPAPRLAARLAPVPADYGGGWRGAVSSLGGRGLFSSSTSALETLSLLPALSRTTNTEHLHLSDEGLHLTTTTAAPSPPTAPAVPPAPAPSAPAPSAPAPTAPAPAPAAPAPAPARSRCGLCRKRLSIATLHLCRCGGQYCAPHRYAEVHGCAYDYKADAGRYLQRANPLVQAPKLPKI